LVLRRGNTGLPAASYVQIKSLWSGLKKKRKCLRASGREGDGRWGGGGGGWCEWVGEKRCLWGGLEGCGLGFGVGLGWVEKGCWGGGSAICLGIATWGTPCANFRLWGVPPNPNGKRLKKGGGKENPLWYIGRNLKSLTARKRGSGGHF